MITPNAHRVKDLLKYNHRTGVFYWKQKPYGLRGYDNPRNVAGFVDPISKKRVIRIDQHVFPALELIKFFPIPIKEQVKTKVAGIAWEKDRNSYRIRVYKNRKTYSGGYSRDINEAILIRRAILECLELVEGK